MSGRNLLESEGIGTMFYSAADGLLAASDGRIADRTNNPIPNTDSWGSDLAAVETTCGPNPAVLATAAGDAQTHDQIQLYEIVNGQPAPASEALSLPGPVTALWPAETPGQATLVVRNSKTGNYEASRLGLACTE